MIRKYLFIVSSLVISTAGLQALPDSQVIRPNISPSLVAQIRNKKADYKSFTNNIYNLFCLLDLTHDDSELEQVKKGIVVEVNGKIIPHQATSSIRVRNNSCIVRVSLLKTFPQKLRDKMIDLILDDNPADIDTSGNAHPTKMRMVLKKLLKIATKYISVSFTFDYQINPEEKEYLLADILVAHKLPNWIDNGYHWKPKWESLQTIGFIIHDKHLSETN